MSGRVVLRGGAVAAAVAAAAAGALLCACGGGGAGAATASTAVVTGTPTVQVVTLKVTLAGEPQRSFGGGRWRVCDSGTVTNPSPLVARDVRVVVTYLDHGAVDGQTTRDDAGADGGALGDLPPGSSHTFTVCGYARNEPDQDLVSAAPAP